MPAATFVQLMLKERLVSMPIKLPLAKNSTCVNVTLVLPAAALAETVRRDAGLKE